jgi:hypothetical protein
VTGAGPIRAHSPIHRGIGRVLHSSNGAVRMAIKKKGAKKKVAKKAAKKAKKAAKKRK